MDALSKVYSQAPFTPPPVSLTFESTAASRALREATVTAESVPSLPLQSQAQLAHLQVVELLSGLMLPASPAPQARVPAANSHDVREIREFLGQAARAYGTNPKVLDEIARRESNYRSQAVNNWDSNARRGTPSQGMFQFIRPTFNSMAPRARAANPQAWEGLGPLNWMDWRQQALTTAWAIKNGLGSHWSTYGAARRTAGA